MQPGGFGILVRARPETVPGIFKHSSDVIRSQPVLLSKMGELPIAKKVQSVARSNPKAAVTTQAKIPNVTVAQALVTRLKRRKQVIFPAQEPVLGPNPETALGIFFQANTIIVGHFRRIGAVEDGKACAVEAG